MNDTAKQLRTKTSICRKNAAGKTGESYHREMQKAADYDAKATEREVELWCDKNEGIS